MKGREEEKVVAPVPNKHLIAHIRLCYVSNDAGFRIRIAFVWCFLSVMVAFMLCGRRARLAGERVREVQKAIEHGRYPVFFSCQFTLAAQLRYI